MENMNYIMNPSEMQNMLGGMMQVTKDNTEGLATIRSGLTLQGQLISGLASQFNGMSDKVIGLEDRITTLEYNEEITDEQRLNLNQRCKDRVSCLLDYNDTLINKYFRTYILDLYKFLKQNYGMGAKLATTKKGNYDRAMRGIDAWYPEHDKLRNRADKKKQQTA